MIQEVKWEKGSCKGGGKENEHVTGFSDPLQGRVQWKVRICKLIAFNWS